MRLPCRERRTESDGTASLGVKRVTRPGCWKLRTALKDRTGCCAENLSTEAERARRPPREPAPAVHTVGKENRKRFREAYTEHVRGLVDLRECIVGALNQAVEAGNFTIDSLLAGLRATPA